jgi:Zn-dependent protease
LQTVDVAAALISFVILLLSLSFHEAAHAWTANRLGDPTARLLGRLTLNPLRHIDWIGTVLFPLVSAFSGFPLLGWAKPVPMNFQNLKSPQRDFAVVALAGPVSNLILAVGAAIVLRALTMAPVGEAAGALRYLEYGLSLAVVLNVLLAIFNLIPVPPLDGGNVLLGVAPPALARAVAMLRPYGFLILYGLLFSGVLDRVIFPISSAIADWLI